MWSEDYDEYEEGLPYYESSIDEWDDDLEDELDSSGFTDKVEDYYDYED